MWREMEPEWEDAHKQLINRGFFQKRKSGRERLHRRAAMPVGPNREVLQGSQAPVRGLGAALP